MNRLYFGCAQLFIPCHRSGQPLELHLYVLITRRSDARVRSRGGDTCRWNVGLYDSRLRGTETIDGQVSIGRRNLMLILSVVMAMTCGIILIPSFPCLVIGRLIEGICVGYYSAIAPIFSIEGFFTITVREVSPPCRFRGG